jgi:molybdenum cofactor cytidylyltransferase
VSAFVSGLILAAGKSTRLGASTKQLLPWRGTTLLEWVVRQVERSPLDEVLVVLGHQSEEVRRRVSLVRSRFVEASDFSEGCSASIRNGLRAVSAESEAAVLILGDQPEIDVAAITAVVEGWEKLRSPVVRISYRGHSGHPVLVSRSIFPQIEALRGDKGVWKLLEAHPEWIREFELDLPLPRDVNRWEDYASLTGHSGTDV